MDTPSNGFHHSRTEGDLRGERGSEIWPALPLDSWQETYETLHLWTQVVGKVKLARAEALNHWWHIPLYVTCSGLSTGPIPDGTRTFHIDFDFQGHTLTAGTSDGLRHSLLLKPRSVADFYRETMDLLGSLDIEAKIWPMPVEIEPRIPFADDHEHGAYDAEYAARFWRILIQVDRIFRRFRSSFLGKASPIHFFWGAFDLCVTRFSGRPAPRHPGGIPSVSDEVMHEAYSHEVSSCGFWPGGGAVDGPAFYAYAYPEPDGFMDYPILPAEAYYHEQLREFILPYDAVRAAADPEETLMAFLQSTYSAAADLGGWDRTALERATT